MPTLRSRHNSSLFSLSTDAGQKLKGIIATIINNHHGTITVICARTRGWENGYMHECVKRDYGDNIE